MKLTSFLRIVFLSFVIFIIYLYWSFRSEYTHIIIKNITAHKSNAQTDNLIVSSNRNYNLKYDKIYLAVVACGDRIKEAFTMLKSALMFTKTHLNFVIFCEDALMLDFKEKLSEWRVLTNRAFSYEILPLTFPKDNPDEWRRLFKQCAAQRLFLPSLLPHIDSVLYMDTDTLFLTGLETIWEHFYKMNSTQMAALVPETEDPNIGWYNRFAKHPYYGKLGVNSGVLLMNLTKMREFKWTEYVVPIYKKYKLKITFGDQDIINIIFHYHPDKLYIYPCQYNFRPDHCMYMSICKTAEKEGVMVLHGSRGFFHSEKQPVFQVIYKAFEEYQIGQDQHQNFLLPLESYLETTADSNCGHVRHIFLKNVQKFININDIT